MSTGTVLLVDDESAIREILSIYVEELGFDCIQAKDGEEGLEKVISEDPDFVVSDYTMPRKNGIEFLRGAREAGFKKPFIILTGNGTKDVALEALHLGAFDFLDKPFDAAHLLSLFKDAMQKSKELIARGTVGGDSTGEDESNSATEADFSLSVNISLQPEEYNEKLEDFLTEFKNQLTFCIASVKALGNTDNIKIELGYLFRTMREMTEAAAELQLYDLALLGQATTDCYMYFRTHPKKLQHAQKLQLAQGLNSLLNQFQSLQTEGSVNLKGLQTRMDLARLHESLMNKTPSGGGQEAEAEEAKAS